MEKQFCSYEVALKLKELGFDKSCFGYYTKIKNISYLAMVINVDKSCLIDVDVLAPLWQQAIAFLLKELEGIDFLASVRVFSDQSGDIVLDKGKNEISFDTLEECVNSIIEILTEQNKRK